MAITHPKQVSNQHASALRANSSISALVVHTVDADGNYVSPGAGSTQLSIREILTSSGASVMDSTNNAIGVTIRAGSAAGTEYTDGDTDATPSGGAIFFSNGTNTMRVVSSTLGLPVNVIAGSAAGSTIVTVSTGSVRVHQSSAGDLNVTVAGYVAPSTTVSVSTGSVRVHQSTAGDLNVTAVQGGTWNIGTVTTVSSVAGVVKNQIVDRDQSTQVAGVLNTDPASTTWALAVRQVGAVATSTVVSVSTGSVRVHQSSAGDLNVTVAGYVAPSTTVSVSTGSVRVHQSTAGDLLATVSQGGTWNIGTVTTVSSVAGVVKNQIVDRDQSTQVAAVLNDSPASTVWALAVRNVGSAAGGTALADQTAFSTNVTSLTPVGGVVFSGASDVPVGEAGAFRMSSVRALWTTPVDSSGGALTDSTQRALRVTSVDVGGSTQVSVSTGSVRVHQSTAADLNVTVAGYSTVVSVSTGSVRVHQSSAADLNVTVAGYVAPSTVVSVSTGSVRVHQSTAGDLLVTASQGGTWNIGTVTTVTTVSSVAGVLKNQIVDRDSSTQVAGVLNSAPASTTYGVVVREALPTIQSTTIFITSTHSTALYALVSSAAGVRHKVFAFHVTSTHTSPSTLVFMSSVAHDLFHVGFGSGSSGITGANLAVSPPAYLFATAAANALNVRIEGGNSTAASTTLARVSFSYFSEA